VREHRSGLESADPAKGTSDPVHSGRRWHTRASRDQGWEERMEEREEMEKVSRAGFGTAAGHH